MILVILSDRLALISYSRYSNFIFVSKMNKYALNIHLCTYIHDSCVFEWLVGFDFLYAILNVHLRTKNERICSKYPSLYVYSWFLSFWVNGRLWFPIYAIFKFHRRIKNEQLCSKYPSFYVCSWFLCFWVTGRLWFRIRDIKFHRRIKNEQICSKYPSFYVYSWFLWFWVTGRLWFRIRDIQISSLYQKWTNMF